MFGRIGLALAFACFSVLALAGNARAAYPDKNITFIIPYGPGGGFDTYVRKFSPVIEKYLPNHVNVIPKNVPGAGGRQAAAELYRGKPDGYTMEIFNVPGILLDTILGKKTSYDVEKFTWLARLGDSPYVLAVGSKTPYHTVDDLKKAKDLKYAVTSPSSTSYVAGKIMADELGLHITFLTGYTSSAKVGLSIIRGDTQLSLFANRSFARYAQDGDLRAILMLADKSQWKGVPTAPEIGHPDLTALTTGRFVAAAPGTPEKIVTVLETALMKATQDPVIHEWKEKGHHAIAPLDAEASAKRIDYLVKYFSKYKTILANK